MANQTFSENLLRAIVAEFHVLNLQTASREMFGRSYAQECSLKRSLFTVQR
jgi:hypothetical protein